MTVTTATSESLTGRSCREHWVRPSWCIVTSSRRRPAPQSIIASDNSCLLCVGSWTYVSCPTPDRHNAKQFVFYGVFMPTPIVIILLVSTHENFLRSVAALSVETWTYLKQSKADTRAQDQSSCVHKLLRWSIVDYCFCCHFRLFHFYSHRLILG